MHVDQAISIGGETMCSVCNKFGATLACHAANAACKMRYHFPCAREHRIVFFNDKVCLLASPYLSHNMLQTLLCPEHAVGADTTQILHSFAVRRRVYIERDENHLLGKLYGCDGSFVLRIGALIFRHIGQLLPHQLRTHHTK